MSLFRRFSTLLAASSLLIASLTHAQEASPPRIFMAGDSTMAIKHLKDYPETGWGVPFAVFFDDTIVVQNYAKNGRSTRTFKEEGLWDLIETQLRPGDVVFIQFGHNDESEKKVDRYTTPAEYKANLTQMITVTRAKGADPILLSPIVRRHFKEDGTLKQTHPYAELVREVAAETGVTFIDAERITKTYFEGLGDRDSALRFMHIEPNLHPNYPNGIRDNTHTNALGAREVAQLMLRALKEMDHPLVAHLRQVDPKHLKEHY